MRISIVGNCQVRGLAKCIRVLCPGAEVDPLWVGGLAQRFDSPAALLGHLRASEHVYFHAYETAQFYGLAEDLLREVPHAREVPSIVFSGFHPDMVYVQHGQTDRTLQLLKSPVGDNHSALALFGWKAGLDVAASVRLFEPAVIRRVNLRSMWQTSEDSFHEIGQRLNCPLPALSARWSRRGCFMHTINHPKIFVLADIARWMLERTGVAYSDLTVEDYVIDDLVTSTIWPVYEGLAADFGLRGSYLFRNETMDAHFGLEEFVAQSHAIYEQHRREDVVCWLSDYWLSDPTLRRNLVEMTTR